MPGTDGEAQVTIGRGAIYLPAALVARYFAGIEGVILLWREERIVIMPVRHLAGGGYLLKLRNSRGDRVVQAADFFLDHGIDGETERQPAASWRTDWAGLVLDSAN
ncbi:MAG: hypothetical protein R3F54_19455 [Alphaproteobacteria bacterium]